MRRDERDREFSAFVAARRPHLRRLAFLVSGDAQVAEDILQIALMKVYLAWPRIRSRDRPESYVRTVLVRVTIDESRRPWRRESAVPAVPDAAVTAPGVVDDALLRALRSLPTGQRTAVALRYWEDLSIEETAAVMGCSTSTVKSHSARGLARLRTVLATAGAQPGGGLDE